MPDRRGGRILLLAIVASVAPDAVAAVDSQALGIAQALPAAVDRVFPCGRWTAAGQRGYHRVVLVQVGGGAGTEVYVQRVLDAGHRFDNVVVRAKRRD